MAIEAKVLAKCVRGLAVAAALVAWGALACAQQPSKPIAPELPGKEDDRIGLGASTLGPIPDTSRKADTSPEEKPVAPPPQPVQPPASPTR